MLDRTDNGKEDRQRYADQEEKEPEDANDHVAHVCRCVPYMAISEEVHRGHRSANDKGNVPENDQCAVARALQTFRLVHVYSTPKTSRDSLIGQISGAHVADTARSKISDLMHMVVVLKSISCDHEAARVDT